MKEYNVSLTLDEIRQLYEALDSMIEHAIDETDDSRISQCIGIIQKLKQSSKHDYVRMKDSWLANLNVIYPEKARKYIRDIEEESS